MMPGERTLSKAEIADALKAKGCFHTPEDGGHFVGVSGKHLSGYYNIDPALPDVELMSELCRQLVEPFKDAGVEVVFVPAIGAIPMAEWGPYHLRELTGRKVAGVWADKVKPRGFVIERTGFEMALKGKTVLILEDIVNQMFSVTELVKLAKGLGCEVVGVGGVMVKDTASAEAIGVPKLVSLYDFRYDAWEPADCELCQKHVPIVTDPALGHGQEYKEAHPDYEGGYTTSVGHSE
jgi:orotate phosphoribosyltransferase